MTAEVPGAVAQTSQIWRRVGRDLHTLAAAHSGGSSRVSWLRRLAGCPAAVDQDGLAGDERGGRGCQEHYDAGYLYWFADAVQGGDPLDDVRAELRVRQRGPGAGRADEGGGDRVHGDPVLAPFHGQAPGQVRDGGLGHAVDGFAGQRDRPRLGADVDDFPGLLPDHDAPGGLAGQERPLEVDGQGRVEGFLPDVLGRVAGRDAGVVDQDG